MDEDLRQRLKRMSESELSKRRLGMDFLTIRVLVRNESDNTSRDGRVLQWFVDEGVLKPVVQFTDGTVELHQCEHITVTNEEEGVLRIISHKEAIYVLTNLGRIFEKTAGGWDLVEGPLA